MPHFLILHVFTCIYILHFGILLREIVKPRDHDEIKPPVTKIFRKYKPIRHYFVTTFQILISATLRISLVNVNEFVVSIEYKLQIFTFQQNAYYSVLLCK